MLIPLMFWPDGWDHPISLAEASGQAEDSEIAVINWQHSLSSFMELWQNDTNSKTDRHAKIDDRTADFFVLYDKENTRLELEEEYVLTIGNKTFTGHTYAIPDMIYEMLYWQDDTRPVFLATGNTMMEKLRHICCFWLIKGAGALHPQAGYSLFKPEGFLPMEVRSEYELKLLAGNDFYLFGRKDLRRLIDDRVKLGACDLHMHTTASDSSDSPQKVCQRAIHNGLKTFAVTDHDNMTGIEQVGKCISESANTDERIYFIPGVEISVQQEREIHLLAYFPLGGYAGIESFLIEQQKSREQRNYDMISTLQSLGYDITIDELIASGDHSVGRMQTALLLKARGYVKTTGQAFDEILGEGKPGYIERPRPPLREAIWQIRKAGGLPVIAHPALYGWCRNSTDNQIPAVLFEKLAKFKDWGMLGVECFHGEARSEDQQILAQAALKLGLLITGGSDDHGTNKQNTHMYDAGTNFSLPIKSDIN